MQLKNILRHEKCGIFTGTWRFGLVFPQFAHESAAEFSLFKCHSPFYHQLYSLILWHAQVVLIVTAFLLWAEVITSSRSSSAKVTSPSVTCPLSNSCANHPGRTPVLASLHCPTMDHCLRPLLLCLSDHPTATLQAQSGRSFLANVLTRAF